MPPNLLVEAARPPPQQLQQPARRQRAEDLGCSYQPHCQAALLLAAFCYYLERHEIGTLRYFYWTRVHACLYERGECQKHPNWSRQVQRGHQRNVTNVQLTFNYTLDFSHLHTYTGKSKTV